MKSLTEHLWFEVPGRRGFVNITDTVERLVAKSGVAEGLCLVNAMHITVSRTIQRLQRDGLVTALPYRSIFLTDAGRKLSEESRRRHQIVVEFLESLGVPPSAAHSDAEGIEHHVSKETLDAFVKHLRTSPRRQ